MPDSPQLERPARPQRRHSASGGSLLNHSLSSALRAFGVIFLGELSLVLTIWLVFGSFHHTQLMAIGTMVRGGVFCTALVLLS